MARVFEHRGRSDQDAEPLTPTDWLLLRRYLSGLQRVRLFLRSKDSWVDWGPSRRYVVAEQAPHRAAKHLADLLLCDRVVGLGQQVPAGCLGVPLSSNTPANMALLVAGCVRQMPDAFYRPVWYTLPMGCRHRDVLAHLWEELREEEGVEMDRVARCIVVDADLTDGEARAAAGGDRSHGAQELHRTVPVHVAGGLRRGNRGGRTSWRPPPCPATPPGRRRGDVRDPARQPPG